MLRGALKEARRALPLLCSGSGERATLSTAATTSAGTTSTQLSTATDRMKALLQRGESEKALDVFGQLGVDGGGRGKLDRASVYKMADACDFALRAYANLGLPDPAARLVSTMWQQGIPVGRVANSSVVKALCEAGRIEDALKYLKSVSAQRSDIVGYNVLFTALRHRVSEESGGVKGARRGDYDLGVRAWEVLEKKMAKNDRLRPDVITWSAVVRVLGAGGRTTGMRDKRTAASTLSFYDKWLEVAASYSIADITSVGASYVGWLCAAGEFEAALEACESLLAAVTEAGCLPVEVIDGSVIEGVNNVTTDERIVGKTNKHASPICNVRVACNTVLHACVSTSNDNIMDRVIHAMTSRGLTPDTVTYNALLRRSLRRREGSLAIKDGLAEMQRMGMLPDQTSIEILIQSFALQGQIEDAEQAVGVIIDKYDVEVGRAWGTLMAACGMAGDVENVAHVFSSAVQYCERGDDRRGMEGNGDDRFMRLAASCLKALHDAVGKECWRRVLHAPVSTASSLPPSDKEALFEYLEEVAMGLLESVDNLMLRKNVGAMPTDDKMLCLAALGKENEVMEVSGDIPLVHGEDRMMEVLQDVEERPSTAAKMKTNNSNKHAVLHAMARLGKLEHCFGLIRQHGLEISAKEYVALIEACAGHSPPMEELARRLMAHARARGLYVDTRFYNALLLVRARLEGLDGVHDGIDEMRARGVEPNVFSYFVLREAAVLAKDGHAAEAALEKIKCLQHGYGTRTGGPWRGFYEIEFGDDDW